MTHTKDEALKLALEALKAIVDAIYVNRSQESDAVYAADKAITAIKQALAAPAVQEPVAWMRNDGKRVTTAAYRHNYPDYETRYSIPLYTTPPAQPATKESLETQTASAYVKTYHGGKPWPLQPAPAPEGWKLVPVNPTKEMIYKGRTDNTIHGPAYAEACYRAMLASAPEKGQP